MWVFSRMHQRNNEQYRGFTIVELLIVIVVIGILAAITIVAFNGVQNRAKASAAQAAATQATKKILAFSIDNSDTYPAAAGTDGTDNLTALGIVNNGDTTYQYSSNNTASPRTFCVTVTKADQSYYVSNATTAPTNGGCPGHGVGGVAAITNLVVRPSASASWTGGYGTSGAGSSASSVTDARFPNGLAYRLTWTTAATGVSGLYVSSASSIPCVIGQRYFFSVRYAASWSGAVPTFYISGPNAGATATVIDSGDGTKEARGYYVAGASCTTTFASFFALASGSGLPVATSTLLVGGFMVVAVTANETYTYADGSSSNWAWSGATNNSTSMGPAL